MGFFDALIKTLAEEEKKKPVSGRKTAEKRPAKRGLSQAVLAKKLATEIADLERKKGALEEREKLLASREKQIGQERKKIEGLKKTQIEKLEKIAKMTFEEARKLLLEATEKRLAEDIARRIRETEEEIKTTVEEKAKEVLVDAMQHGATDYVAEYTVSTVQLPDEEMKGRIIGREGRNIRAFERATGVEIELDEENTIHLSSFDPVRREIARKALSKLIRDRRIQPARIKELVQGTKEEMEKILYEEGQKLCHGLKVYRLHPELIKLLGRFKFRFSYGQNMVSHTLEEAKIGIQIAEEVGANVNIVRLGCLLHDIGKVVTEEEGTHVQLGVGIAKKYRLPKEVVACIAEHHEDKPFSLAESRIVWIADAISGSRPGARYEAHEEYVKRMEDIENTVKQFKEVEEVYAYQAGRYVMVLVKPDLVTDDELTVFAQKVKEKLEEEVSYSGQIKVACIRETQAIETTKAK